MQIFKCPACDKRVYLDNIACRCRHAVTYHSEINTMRTEGAPCANRDTIGCNWLAEDTGFCRSCVMTHTVPDMDAATNAELWATTASVKRYMLVNLAHWGWFTDRDPGARPGFRLLSEQTATGQSRVVMGHASGVITINVTEASEAIRVERREELGELYRTMIGHMRHEMAHFLHLRLSADPAFNADFRALFGDEREDYGAALKRHYDAPQSASDDHITSYATSHPHEDWAETTAHLLHLVDLLDSAAAAGLALPGGPPAGYNAYDEPDTNRLIRHAVDMAIAINHVNRALELPDLYPFILGAGVRKKLAFIHDHLRRGPMGQAKPSAA